MHRCSSRNINELFGYLVNKSLLLQLLLHRKHCFRPKNTTWKNEMCEKSRNRHLLCIEAVDVQYSHLLDYCAFPGFTRPCEREEERWWTGSVFCFRRGSFKPLRCALDPAPSQPALFSQRLDVTWTVPVCHLNTLLLSSCVLRKSNTGLPSTW